MRWMLTKLPILVKKSLWYLTSMPSLGGLTLLPSRTMAVAIDPTDVEHIFYPSMVSQCISEL